MLTFIGDCEGQTLFEREEIWRSPVLVLEATFLEPGEEEFARSRGHSHVADIARALAAAGDQVAVQHLVLKHFSMRYEPEQIRTLVRAAIPERFQGLVRLML
ncbi:MAG: hypothetical protein QM765_51455 [Myxococcales bacterium]